MTRVAGVIVRLAVLAVLAAAASPARAGEREPPCGAPLPTVDAVGQCLGASVRNPGPWSVLATTPSARLVRAGNPLGPTVFVVAMRGSGWAAVAEVESEPGQGPRRAELRAGAAAETSIGAHVVTRFDVHVDDERDAAVELAGERSILCVIDGRCLDVTTDCQATRTTGKDSRSVGQAQGRVSGRAQLGADGLVTLTALTVDDPARLCARSPAAQRLWSEPPAAADRPRWTAPRACTVVAARAYFRDPLALTPLRAYVLAGDRVEVSDRGDGDPSYVVARYQGAKKLTIGVLDAKSLDCAAPKPAAK